MTREQKPQEAKTEGRKSGNAQHQIIKEGKTGDIQDTGVVFGTIMKTVSEDIASAAKKSSKTGVSVLESVSGIVRTAVRGSLGAGNDLIVGTKAIVMGVIQGTDEKETAALKTLAHTVRTVLRQTAEVNGDLAAATTGLVLGAIAGAEHMGVDRSKAASAVSRVALEEANQIGPVAADKVRGALKKDIGGISSGSSEPLKT